MRILGCDPGLTGAMCLLVTDNRSVEIIDTPVRVIRKSNNKPRTEYDVALMANQMRALAPDFVFIEQVSAMPGQGVTSMFRFGMGFGILQGIVAGLSKPVNFVVPNVWTREMRVPKGKDGSRLRASQLLPAYSDLFQRVKDHGRADAALIALYGERTLDNPF